MTREDKRIIKVAAFASLCILAALVYLSSVAKGGG